MPLSHHFPIIMDAYSAQSSAPPHKLGKSTKHMAASFSASAVAGAATGTEKVACVTGGSGYIASWIVQLLLARGYTVRATVRDPDDTEKTAHLRAMEGAGDRLHLFKADLLEEGSFDAVVAGCHCVFHTASPVVPNARDPQQWHPLCRQRDKERLDGLIEKLLRAARLLSTSSSR